MPLWCDFTRGDVTSLAAACHWASHAKMCANIAPCINACGARAGACSTSKGPDVGFDFSATDEGREAIGGFLNGVPGTWVAQTVSTLTSKPRVMV